MSKPFTRTLYGGADMSDEIRVTYFDTAMVLIEVGGVRLLTDPVLDPAGSAFDYGLYRLEKTSPVSVTPEQLGRIDAVLLSHEQHGDNLARAGRDPPPDAPRPPPAARAGRLRARAPGPRAARGQPGQGRPRTALERPARPDDAGGGVRP